MTPERRKHSPEDASRNAYRRQMAEDARWHVLAAVAKGDRESPGVFAPLYQEDLDGLAPVSTKELYRMMAKNKLREKENEEAARQQAERAQRETSRDERRVQKICLDELEPIFDQARAT